jgi:hypothetical protein
MKSFWHATKFTVRFITLSRKEVLPNAAIGPPAGKRKASRSRRIQRKLF